MIKGPSSILTTPKDAVSRTHMLSAYERGRQREKERKGRGRKTSLMAAGQDPTMKFQLDFWIRGFVRAVELSSRSRDDLYASCDEKIIWSEKKEREPFCARSPLYAPSNRKFTFGFCRSRK